MNVKKLALAILIAATSITGAFAADVIAPIPLDRPSIIQVVDNFDGPYFGIGATTIWDTNEYTPTLSIGVNKRFDAVVVGGEAWGAVNVVDNAPVIQTLGFDAKAGFVVTDTVAVYALAGVEVAPDTSIVRNTLGVGADVVLTDNVSLTGSYKYVTDFGSFDNPSHRVSVGLKFPF